MIMIMWMRRMWMLGRDMTKVVKVSIMCVMWMGMSWIKRSGMLWIKGIGMIGSEMVWMM